MAFHLSCGKEVLSLLGEEADAVGCSTTEYVNTLLLKVCSVPNTLASGSKLQEVDAYALLCNDELMPTIREIAEKNKRHPIQQIWCLVEIGLKHMNQEVSHSSNFNSSKVDLIDLASS